MLRIAPRFLPLAFLMFFQAGFGEDVAPPSGKIVPPFKARE
jgi:hypothetical protein